MRKFFTYILLIVFNELVRYFLTEFELNLLLSSLNVCYGTIGIVSLIESLEEHFPAVTLFRESLYSTFKKK